MCFVGEGVVPVSYHGFMGAGVGMATGEEKTLQAVFHGRRKL